MSRSAMDKHSIPVVTVFPDLSWLGMLHSKSQHRHRRYEVSCAVTLVGEPWSDPSYPSIMCAACEPQPFFRRQPRNGNVWITNSTPIELPNKTAHTSRELVTKP